MTAEHLKEKDTSKSPVAASIAMESATIDPVIHKRAMLKFDTVVLGCFGIMYLLANLDRNNLVSFACSVSHSCVRTAKI